MKIEDLKKALRNIIKEEVKKAVQEEVSKAMAKVLVEMVKEIKKPTKVTEEVEEEEPVVMEESPIKTHNPKLNAVLTETARHFKPLRKTVDASMGLAAMMEGDFDKVGGNEDIGINEPNFNADTKIDFLKSMVTPGVPQQTSVLDNGGAAVPDVLKGVFKKDFRAIMKKMDEQKKIGSGGMINRSSVIQG